MKVDLAYAERQLRHWTKKAEELRLTSNASNAKEDEKGKETFPPAPPIEKSEKEKKGAGEGEDARARKVAMVSAYNAEIGGNIDAEYFVDYYADHWPRNWRARLRNWLKEDKKSGRFVRAIGEERRGRSPRPTDWTLCAERCANCDGTRCLRGIATPPPNENPPRPPEECAHYKPTTNN